MSKMLTKVQNLGARRHIPYLPPNGKTLDHNEVAIFDGLIDTSLFLADSGKASILADDEEANLLKVWYEFGGRTLKFAGAPTSSTDLATKGYVDAAVAGAGPGGSPAQSVTVAQSGAGFTSIQAAINSITDASSSKPYVVLIYPGFYNETIVCKDFVHLQGIGSVEYSNSSVVIQGTNDLITTKNCNILNIRFNLQTGGSGGLIRLINGAGTGTTFRCTFMNCYFLVNGNFGANLVKLCENNGTSDIFIMHSSVYWRPISSVGCITFDSVNGTNSVVDLYMNHFLPSGSSTLIFWRKQAASASDTAFEDEVHLVYFRENTTDPNLVLFRNESQANIRVNGAFCTTQETFAGTYVQATSTGTVLMGGAETFQTTIRNIFPASVPLVIQGAPSQTANLQNWKDSTGAVRASVDAAGAIQATSLKSTLPDISTIPFVRRFRASDIVGISNGNPVGSWIDSAGSGDPATSSGGSRPTFQTNVINGKPVVRFNGSSNYLRTTAGGASLTGNFYVACVFQLAGLNAFQMTLSWGEESDHKRRSMLIWSSDVTSNNDPNTVTFNGQSSDVHQPYGTPPLTTGTPILFEIYFDGTFIHLYQNGVMKAVVQPTNDFVAYSASGYPITLGAGNASSGNWLNGDMAEALFLGSLPTGNQLMTIRSYMASEYALSVQLGGTMAAFESLTLRILKAFDDSTRLAIDQPMVLGGDQPKLTGDGALSGFTGIHKALLTVFGAIYADCIDRGDHILLSRRNAGNVLCLWNQHVHGFSSMRTLRYDGSECGAIGWANPGNTPWGGDDGNFMLEFANFFDSTKGGQCKIVQTGRINGGTDAPYVRCAWLSNGDLAFYDLSNPYGIGADVPIYTLKPNGTILHTQPPFTLTFASSLTANCNNGDLQRCAVTNNVTIMPPSNGADGARMELWLKPNSGYTVGFDGAILVPSDSTITLPKSMTANKTYLVLLKRNGSTWYLVSLIGGY